MARDFSTFSENNANEKEEEEEEEEEDYIDIEVSPSSSSTFFCYSITSPHPREFEFQMSSKSLERDLTTSPADELFYKGNLLPLHLPPRLQMVQNLLNNNSNTNSTNYEKKSAVDEDENFTTPLTTTNTTPFESCNISPADSCRVSRELNRDEYFLECSTEMSGFIDENPKKSWSKKLKLIKKSSLGLKLKASSAYLKSLFSKSGCSEESCAEAAKNIHERAISKTKECLNKYIKVAKKNPFGQIQKGVDQIEVDSIRGTDKEKMIEDNGSHRRSFSGAIKRHCATKSSSSLSSSGSSSSMLSSTSSNGFFELHMLKRSNSANSEIETSIQGAIAHCKQSQQIFCSRKNPSDVGFCSFSATKIAACEEQERPQICRG